MQIVMRGKHPNFAGKAMSAADRRIPIGARRATLAPRNRGKSMVKAKFRREVLAAAGLLTLGACTSAPATDGAASGRIVWPRLEKFSGDAEFERYLKSVQAARRRTRTYGAADGRLRLAQADTSEAAPEECLDIDCISAEEIVVTGARISAPASPSITNNQKSGVDEGDIVKLIGRHLVILQDGRLFSVDLGEKSGAMRVAGRTNVYDNPDDDAWYDEMVVNGDLIAVLGYSYARDASEVTVLRVGDDGGFTRLDKFFINSEDYYDEDNYATRLIGDKLILYTPIDLYWAARNGALPDWPVIRRAQDFGADGEPSRAGRPLLAATNIYRPVQLTLRPVLHAVTVCPIGRKRPAECSTQGVIGPWDREYFVSEDSAYLWIDESHDLGSLVANRGGCANFQESEFGGFGSFVYRLPVSGRSAGFLRASGAPFNQFSLDASEEEFRALLSNVGAGHCDSDDAVWEDVAFETAYFSAPLRSFTLSGERQAPSRYTKTPDLDYEVENRFTETHVVYGARSNWTSYPPDAEDGPRSSQVVAAPVANPSAYATLTAPHEVIRVERAGDAVVLTGYADASGLNISTIDLRAAPRLAATAKLDFRFETEGRSHAFNSLVGEDGAGMIGLPTATLSTEAGRWWWRSETSDVSFLKLDADLGLTSVGSLYATPVPPSREDLDEDGDLDAADKVVSSPAGYQCEVSCVDWYGNSRPIFIGERVFALSGFELIEGALSGDRIIEVARIDVTKGGKR